MRKDIMPSETHYEEEHNHNYKKEEESSNQSPVTKKGIHIYTMIFFAGVMIFFVLLIGFVGFIPMYLIGFDTASHAMRLAHDEAINSLLAVLNYSVIQVPNIVNLFSSHYYPFLDADEVFLPDDKSSILLAMTNILSGEGLRDKLGYIILTEVQLSGDVWGIFSITKTNDSSAYTSTCVIRGPNLTNVNTVCLDKKSVYDLVGRSLTKDFILEPQLTPGSYLYSNELFVTNDDLKLGFQMKERWALEDIYHQLSFSYFLPFVTKNSLIIWGGSIWVSVLKNEILTVLDKYLGKHGRFMLLDSKGDIVVTNNWGQEGTKQNKNGNALVVKPLILDEINDNLMRETRDNLNRKGKLRELLNDQNIYEFSFLHMGTVAYARILRLKDFCGLDITVWTATLETELLQEVYMARTFVAVASGLSVTLVATFAVFLAYIIVKPLHDLMPALERASNLQLRGENTEEEDDDCGNNGGTGRKTNKKMYSCIKEIREIQKIYAELTRQLRIVKTFVPEAILAAPRSRHFSRERLFGDSKFTDCFFSLSKSNQFETNEPVDIEIIDQKSFAKARQEMRLNVNVFKEEPNTFTRRYCTVVLIENTRPLSLDVYFNNVLNCANEQNGCVEYLRPDRILVSFGAHLPLPMHSIKGCRFAFELFAKLKPEEQETITILVDSNEFLVGTCGSQLRNARVVVGVIKLRELVKVAKRLDCHLAATAGTVSQLQDNQAFPVECVLLSSSPVPVVLSELRPPSLLTSLSTTMVSKHFRLGFAAMRQGLYEQAMRHYQRIGKSDPQARRLLRLCAERCAKKESKNYVRLATDILHANIPNIGFAASKALIAQESKGRIENNLEKKRLKKRKGRSSMQVKSSKLKEKSVCGDGTLFEMLTISSNGSSDSSNLLAEGISGADDVPLFLTDMNQKVWTRSLKKISEGAFSTVYLGMSEDGVQVAIKCIPRQRRDIMQESLEAEMNFASKLRHPNIVQYVSCSVVQSCLAIIMEYVPGGSLHTVINNFGRVSPLVARRFTVDILNGLNYLHGIGVVHCDVKPHNVLLGMDGVCKLSDFGSTISEAADMARTLADEVTLRGTALYMAPEVARGGRCTPQSDIFSLGISLLEMLLGQLPWRWSCSAPEGSDAASLHALFNRDMLFVQGLARGYIEPDIPDSLHNEVACFVRSCCHSDPAMRPSALSLLSYAFVL